MTQSTLPGLGAPTIGATLPKNLLIGTSSWSAKEWSGVFYPPELKPVEFIGFYATRLPAVEIDATFYAIPARRTVEGWRDRTPPHFKFAAKVPQIITHTKTMIDCREDLMAFLEAMDPLGERLGPMLLQFPYFKKSILEPEEFLGLLRAFLPLLPRAFKFALELRNKTWVTEELLDLLRGAGVALALIDHPWFHRPGELVKKLDVLTADFTYVRWLGDRYKIEEQTTTWNKTIVDRTKPLIEWAQVIRDLLSKNVMVYAFANNHYGGYAIETLKLFEEIFGKTSQ